MANAEEMGLVGPGDRVRVYVRKQEMLECTSMHDLRERIRARAEAAVGGKIGCIVEMSRPSYNEAPEMQPWVEYARDPRITPVQCSCSHTWTWHGESGCTSPSGCACRLTQTIFGQTSRATRSMEMDAPIANPIARTVAIVQGLHGERERTAEMGLCSECGHAIVSHGPTCRFCPCTR